MIIAIITTGIIIANSIALNCPLVLNLELSINNKLNDRFINLAERNAMILLSKFLTCLWILTALNALIGV